MIGWASALFLIFVSFVTAFSNWRKGLLFCLVVGVLQDPVRKLIPGQPVSTQLLVLASFLLVGVGIFLSGQRIGVRRIYGGNQRLVNAGNFLLLVVILQCVHTLVRYGNPMLAGLGVITYFAPLAAATVGWIYARNPQDIFRFMKVYLWIAIPVCLTVYLSYWYPGRWDILKEVGEFVGRRLIIYDVGTVMYSYSGLLRVGEVAAWHAAMSCIFLFLLANRSSTFAPKLLAGLLFVALVGVIMLTGRRKMLVALLMFLGIYMFFIAAFWRGRRRLGFGSLLAGLFFAGLIWTQFPDISISPYLQRGASVFGDASGRIDTSNDLFRSAVFRAGILGKGAGVSAQGSQYFGGGERIVGGSAEAGAGKLYVELGLAGFIAIIWLVLQMGQHFRRMLQTLQKINVRDTTIYAGILAAVLANAFTFFAATQLFGDMFVQLMLGVMVGMCLSASKILAFERQKAAMSLRSGNSHAPA